MRLEQVIRSTMTEAADMDGRLDQLVRAGLMPTGSLPLLKRALSRMHAGMSLQGAERDVMNMFINSMMFIVLGDDTVFNKARAGAKSYATEEKEKQEYDYEGDMAMGQLKSIIANSQRMHDMLSDDTNLPEWVQSKITLAEDYISTASNYMQGEMNEEQIDELSKATMGRYVNKAATKMGSQGVTAGLKIAADEKSSKNFKDMGKREKGIKLAVKKLTKEDAEQIDEVNVNQIKKDLDSGMSHDAVIGKHANKRTTNTDEIRNVMKQHAFNKRMKKEEVESIDELSVKKLDQYRTRARQDIMDIDLDNRDDDRMFDKRAGGYLNASKQIQRKLVTKQIQKKLAKEEVEQVDELSKATMGSYVKKASGAERPKNVMDPKNVPLTKIAAYQGDSETGHFGSRFNQATYDKAERLRKNRETGIKRAVDKLTKEEVEITEASVADVAKTAHLHVRAGKHDSIHTAIQAAVNTHFPSSVHSSVTRKKVAAQALSRIQSSNASKMKSEEVEQVDEISKAMAGRYVKKAAASIDLTAWRQGYKEAGAGNPSKQLEKKLSKRHKGIETAVKKLTNEDIDAVKKMNESYKTAFQTALTEYGIKSPSELDESKRKEFFNHVDLEFKKGDN